MKRTRRDRTEMENILFKLFERQPNWSLKQLMQETDQPEVLFSPFPSSAEREHRFPTIINTFLISKQLHNNNLCFMFFLLCSNFWRRYWMISVSTTKEDQIKGHTSSSPNTRSLQGTMTLLEFYGIPEPFAPICWTWVLEVLTTRNSQLVSCCVQVCLMLHLAALSHSLYSWADVCVVPPATL